VTVLRALVAACSLSAAIKIGGGSEKLSRFWLVLRYASMGGAPV
jgi:hypothetical protein